MISEQEIRERQILETAQAMAVAARTAPKARGTDNLVIKICERKDIELISAQLEKDYEQTGMEFLMRDSRNILSAPYILLIGSRVQVLGLNCAYCGFPSCEEKIKAGENIPCFFNSEDLGLAVGSAVSLCADRRIDSRVMYSAGSAALKLNLMDGATQCLAICLSVSSKNPFFDR
ncbi:MAG: ferredoxin [Bacteroidales bacterium]|nr:ferredoxin [Bacteroidales bacterium]